MWQRVPLLQPQDRSGRERGLRAAYHWANAGAHACPGERLALAIAAAGVRHVLASGLDLERAVAEVVCLPLTNARIPSFDPLERGASP